MLRLYGLEKIIPLTFALDKQNDARCGFQYIHSLEDLDVTHTLVVDRELLQDQGLSVQAQERYPCRTASDENAILNWALNRAAQSENTESLYAYADILIKYCYYPSNVIYDKKDISAYIFDVVVLVNTLTSISTTYRDLSFKMFTLLPIGYHRIDIVADTCVKNSVKASERDKRRIANPVLIQSGSFKVPRNCKDFLKNGQNKTRLIEIIKEQLVKEKKSILEKLECSEVYFSMENVCYLISVDSVSTVRELNSNQEEADTKLLLHTDHAMHNYTGKQVVGKSHSGDTGVNILFASKFIDNEAINLDLGAGSRRKVIKLASIRMSSEHKQSLIGFHAFTGNDYVSSIFKETKDNCWQKLIQNHKFVLMLQQLGNTYDLEEELRQILEEYTCALYGKNKKDVNLVRDEIFKDVYVKTKYNIFLCFHLAGKLC